MGLIIAGNAVAGFMVALTVFAQVPTAKPQISTEATKSDSGTQVAKKKCKAPRGFKTYRKNVERWRDEIRHWLKKYGCWSARAEDFLLHIIEVESKGDPRAKNPSGKYLGLAQMDSRWGSRNQRFNPDYVTRRLVKAYDEGGYANLRDHWCEHHKCSY